MCVFFCDFPKKNRENLLPSVKVTKFRQLVKKCLEMRILAVAIVVVVLAVSCRAIDSEESADRDDFYDSRGECWGLIKGKD